MEGSFYPGTSCHEGFVGRQQSDLDFRVWDEGVW